MFALLSPTTLLLLGFVVLEIQAANGQVVMRPSENEVHHHQRCIAPGGKFGHCRHLQDCPLPEFKKDRLRFMDYFCIIHRTFVGVCCPDSVTSSGVGQLSGLSPEFGDEGQQSLDGSESFGAGKPSSAPNKPVGQTGDSFDTRGCGVTDVEHDTRIVGGVKADPKGWPWMVAILKEDVGHFCGGCILTNKHVLTAGHCISHLSAKEVTVRLGEYSFLQSYETRSHDFNISKVIVHKDFDTKTYENDIAILVLQKTVMFNSYVWPICLPHPTDHFAGETAFVSGWGTTSYGGPVSQVLMEVAIPVWDNDKCADSYLQPIVDTHLCAGAYDGGKDSCQGDSGGPLLLRLPNKRWITIGVVSWGIGCGDKGRPGVYTRVNKYLSWILENTVN